MCETEDVLLVRMTSDSIRPPAQRYNYSNALSGLINLVKEEGVKGLTRGLGTNTVRTSPLILWIFLTGYAVESNSHECERAVFDLINYHSIARETRPLRLDHTTSLKLGFSTKIYRLLAS